jgi:putative hydrolase of the HAD superfamily
MPLTISDRVVVFDYGEVISRTPSERDRADLLGVAGVTPELFWDPYWAHRDALDEGVLSVRDYWKRVGTDIGVEWPESTIHELWVADFTSWLSVDPGTFDILADLHQGGTRIALLSNAGFDFASPFRYSPMARFFERMFISAELMKRKPNADIYLEVAGELGIIPAQMVFIDNKQVNVDGAEALGITGHLFVGHPELRSFLESITDR